METILIIRYGEIALKKRNRSYFEGKLFRNIQNSLKDMSDAVVTKQHGRMFVSYEKEDESEIIDRVTQVFGVVSVSPAVQVENDIEVIKQTAVDVVKEHLCDYSHKSFKVESRRANKGFPLKSPEISKKVGGFLDDQFPQIKVDVKNPDFILQVEVRNKTYVYSKVVAGLSGLPYGCAGRGMLLLSGGIDSPVAGWLMAKRGMSIEAVHFHSAPFTSERAQEKVFDLAKILSRYTGEIIVHGVNLLEIQRAIQAHCPEPQMTILSRRFMMAIAQEIAKETRCQALITGESIGQVASQTIEGLTATNDAVTLPVFRPLIAMDKVDIIKKAKRIGSFETSILPFEDCCTVFLPEKVMTRPPLEVVLNSEGLLDKQNLIKDAIKGRRIVRITPESYSELL